MRQETFRRPTYTSSATHTPRTHHPYPTNTRSIYRPRSTCLCQPCPPFPPNQVPQHSQLPIHIKRLIRLNLHLPNAITRRDALALVYRRLKLVAPRTAPAVSIPIVVAAQKVALRFRALLHGEGYIDGFEEVFCEVGVEIDEVVDVVLDVLGV